MSFLLKDSGNDLVRVMQTRIGDGIDEEAFFTEEMEEEIRLKGGPYSVTLADEFVPIDDFAAEDAFDYGGSSVYVEEPKEPVLLVPDNLEKTREVAKQRIMPIYLAGHRGAAICDPLGLMD